MVRSRSRCNWGAPHLKPIARELEIHGGMALPRRELVDFESQHPCEDGPGRCISFTTHPKYPKIFGCSNRQKDFETSCTPES
jgi:hypothetical protein